MKRRLLPNIRATGWAVSFLAVLGLAYLAIPRRVDLRAFDPVVLGQMETRLWRDYYEHRPVRLALGLYALNRKQFGYSPWDSACLALDAAQTATVFQPTRNRSEAQAARPYLDHYFGRIVRRTGSPADPRKLAESELDWWQLRREQRSAADYATAIASINAALYGVPEKAVLSPSRMRADAMERRDTRAKLGMRPEDWSEIERLLISSYARLHEVVQR